MYLNASIRILNSIILLILLSWEALFVYLIKFFEFIINPIYNRKIQNNVSQPLLIFIYGNNLLI